MARDEALLDGERAVLRRTAWREPAVTIGRFQSWSLIDHAGELRAPVRRITGGGAILHGDDLTLALAAPCPSPLLPERAPGALSERVARAIATALAPLLPGLRTRGGDSAERAQTGVLDCFSRATPCDLVVDGAEGAEKVAGIALHRRGTRVLVQASVRRGDGLPSAADGELLAAIADALGATTAAIPDLDDAEEERSWALVARRYGSALWNLRVRSSDETPVDTAGAAVTPEDVPTTPRAPRHPGGSGR